MAAGQMTMRSEGDVPSGWKSETLTEVIESHRGGVWGPDAEDGPGYAVLRSTNMRGGHLDFTNVARCRISDEVAQECALVPGDILVSKSSGSPHLVGLSVLYRGAPDDRTYLFSNFTMRIRPNQTKVVPQYLALFLTTTKAKADRRRMAQDTAGLRNLKTREYLAQVLPLPPLSEQQQIVEWIERLLEQSRTAREALDRIPPLLKRFRQSVLAKAFRGELTERDPSDEPAPVLLARIREERRRKWEEGLRAKGKDSRKATYKEPELPDTSGLPELPEEWAWGTIGALVAHDGIFVDGDWVETKDQDPNGEIRLIQLADVGEGEFRDRSARFLTNERADALSCTFLRPGDVLIARMPDPLGRACLFPGTGQKCITAVDVCIVRLGDDGASNRWLMHALNSPAFRERVLEKQTGTTRGRISRGNLSAIPLPIPPPSEQTRIAFKIDGLLLLAAAIEQAVERARKHAEHLDQAVLARAFRGQL